MDDPLPRLLTRLLERLDAPGRHLLGITGPPGAGKSTLVERLVAEIGEPAVGVPMDGFHLTDTELARLGRGDRKGAPDTFDVDGYVALLARVRATTDRTVYGPRFDRRREESIAGAIAVRSEHRLVITEGNYLLLQTAGWREVRPLLDEVWYVEVDPVVRVERLVARHVAHGRSTDAAVQWVTTSDESNAELVSTTAAVADLRVWLT